VTRDPFLESPGNISALKSHFLNKNHSFYKAVIVKCLQDKKCFLITYGKVPCLESSLFSRYSEYLPFTKEKKNKNKNKNATFGWTVNGKGISRINGAS